MLPLGISLCILFLSIQQKSRGLVISAFAILWTFSSGLIAQMLWKWLEHPWQRIDESQAPTADLIVVLSGGERQLAPGKANIIEWNDPDRFFAGVKLFQENKASKLFFTGGSNPFNNTIPTQGSLYIEEAKLLGIPSKYLFTTTKVLNTAEEAKAIKHLINETKSQTTILLVTSAFHMQRAKKQFERQGLIVHPFPVDFKSRRILKGKAWKNPYNWIPNVSSLSKSSVALRELLGRAIYRSW